MGALLLLPECGHGTPLGAVPVKILDPAVTGGIPGPARCCTTEAAWLALLCSACSLGWTLFDEGCLPAQHV